MPQTSKRKITSRAPSRAARIRSFAAALGAAGRPTSRPAPAVAAADGVGKEDAAKQLGTQATALEDAIRDLAQRLILTPDVEGKKLVLEQQRLLREALLKVLAQQIKAAFDEEKVKKALARLAEITGKLQKEAKVLKTATELVTAVATVIGFVEEGLMVLAGAGLLA